jgi:hypothetical protein
LAAMAGAGALAGIFADLVLFVVVFFIGYL